MPQRLTTLALALALGCAPDAQRPDADGVDAERRSAAANKVWLCHATSSASNPYVLIHVNQNAWDGQGRNDHTRHEGDYEASGPDEDCGASGGDGTDGTADGTDGTADGTDGTADGTDGTGDGADGTVQPPTCADATTETDCAGLVTEGLICIWEPTLGVCLPGGIE